ncbi:MAG: PAS domain S-box protein [Verrucomicrobiota bacterium]|nr:PAS domain S-box protein [Verrucomicrobiota bacterium]
MPAATFMSRMETDTSRLESRAGWWQCVFDSSDDAQLVCFKSGEVRELNRRAIALLEFSSSKPPEGFFIFELLSPSVSKKLSDLFANPNTKQETLSAVTLVFGGAIRQIIDLQATPLSPDYWLVSIRDASRRWRMESHVQRLITALDATPDVFFLTDSDYRLTFVNAAFQNVTGHTIEDALGRTAHFLRTPSEAARIEEYVESVKQGKDWVGELTNIRADGSTYPVEAVISPIFDRNGKLLGYVSCERDITVKKALQSGILREQNYVRSILNSIDSVIYTLDRSFCITHVNEHWKELPPEHGWVKLKGEPAIGDNFTSYLADEEKVKEFRKLFEQVLATGTPHEFHWSSENGRHWIINISPWTHENEVAGIIYRVADSTKFHELQNQLYQAQKMETIGALAAGIAHDFNNLLQVIRGNITLLLQEEHARKTPHDLRLQQIEQAAARASNITEQLLTFSRASDEKVTVFDFNKVVLEVGQLVQRSSKGNIQFKVESPAAPIKVRMDATRAHQLLLNLCVNAQDAMPQGGTITISNKQFALPSDLAEKIQCAPGSEFLCCSVSDTGTGIPPEIISRIFDPFFTTKETGKGTGLGLSIVHSVVAQAGGFLEVKSKPGHGTTFFIYLPVVDSAIHSEVKPIHNALPRGVGRLLIVEDLDLVRDFTQTFLRSAGFEVLVATNGPEALEILKNLEQPVDLVLTDFNMPGMNGLELMSEIAHLHPGMKFVLASGYLDETERDRILTEHKAKILKKPYNVREATNLILEMLET